MLEQRTDLAPEFTRAIVRTGVSVMPFFRKTEISDAELDALSNTSRTSDRPRAAHARRWSQGRAS